jgi:hypothetical protein
MLTQDRPAYHAAVLEGRAFRSATADAIAIAHWLPQHAADRYCAVDP